MNKSTITLILFFCFFSFISCQNQEAEWTELFNGKDLSGWSANENPESFSLEQILFETTSAIGTVGLSVGITPGLDNTSLIVLILLMFLGRVSFLTFLIGIFNTLSKRKESGIEPYYPKENVFIN